MNNKKQCKTCKKEIESLEYFNNNLKCAECNEAYLIKKAERLKAYYYSEAGIEGRKKYREIKNAKRAAVYEANKEIEKQKRRERYVPVVKTPKATKEPKPKAVKIPKEPKQKIKKVVKENPIKIPKEKPIRVRKERTTKEACKVKMTETRVDRKSVV